MASYVNAAFRLEREPGGDWTERFIHPNEILSISNSIGGWWAKPIRYAGQPMLALIRLTGSQKDWPLERIQSVLGRERGEVLRPGPGLWAISSGAARRGVWHQHKTADPLTEAVRRVGCPASIIQRVHTLVGITVEEGGNLCSHSTHGGSYHEWRSDCVPAGSFQSDCTTEMVAPTYVESHSNQYHVGCQRTAGVVSLAREGTYCIQYAHRSHNGWTGRRELIAIWVTPSADLAEVAACVAEVVTCYPKCLTDDIQSVMMSL